MKSILIAFLLLPVLFLYEVLPQSTTSRKPRINQEEPAAAPKEETRQRPTESPDRTPRPINNPTPVVTPPVEPPPAYTPPVYTPPAEEPPQNNYNPEPVILYDDCCPDPEPPPRGGHPRIIEVSKSKTLFDLYTEQGIEYFDSGYYMEALNEFDSAIEIDSTEYGLYYYRGSTLLKLDKYPDAISDLNIYILIFPEDKDALYNRGLAWFYMNNKDIAYYDFEASAKLGDKRAKSILRRFY